MGVSQPNGHAMEAALAARVGGVCAVNALPPEAPVAMPVQSLTEWDPAQRRNWLQPDLHRPPWLARTAVFVGMSLLTVYGGWEMYNVVEVGGVTALEWALLCLFLLNFSW